MPRGPDQAVEAVSDRGGDRGDGNGNKLAAITEGEIRMRIVIAGRRYAAAAP